MNGWLQLNTDMVMSALSESESGTIIPQADYEIVLKGMIADLTAELRAHVRSGARNRLPAEESLVPDALKSAAVVILRYRLLLRYDLAVSEARTKDWEEANRLLSAVRSGQYSIANQEGESTQLTNPSYTARPQRWGPNKRPGVM